MKDFGKRLKEERERLGMTQEVFAKACGVGRTAQFNYEREEREPSSKYLSALDEIGGDSNYVMSGFRRTEEWIYARGYESVLYAVERMLGLKEGEIKRIAILDVENMRKLHFSSGNQGIISTVAFQEAVIEWLKTTKNPDMIVDFDLVISVLTQIDETAKSLGVTISPSKKTSVASILYRSAKKNALLDKAIIEETVKLAAS